MNVEKSVKAEAKISKKDDEDRQRTFFIPFERFFRIFLLFFNKEKEEKDTDKVSLIRAEEMNGNGNYNSIATTTTTTTASNGTNAVTTTTTTLLEEVDEEEGEKKGSYFFVWIISFCFLIPLSFFLTLVLILNKCRLGQDTKCCTPVIGNIFGSNRQLVLLCNSFI